MKNPIHAAREAQQVRGFRTTEDIALAFGVKPRSVFVALCKQGHYMGLVPRKLDNRFLAWPLATDGGLQA